MSTEPLKKREPLLIDSFLAIKSSDRTMNTVIDPKFFNAIQQKCKVSKRFVLDHEAVLKVGKTIREVPDLLAKHQQFARAPFDTIWIEWNFRTLFEQINSVRADELAPPLTGILIDHNSVFSIIGGAPLKGCDFPILSPFRLDLHTPWKLSDEIKFCEKCHISRSSLDRYFWGTALQFLKEEESIKALRGQHSCQILPMLDSKFQKHITNLLAEVTGTLCNIIAILLLMNRPGITHYVRDVPRQQSFYKGKYRQYLSHTIVSIPVDPQPILQLIGTQEGEAIPRRRHEVRGTYCHDETARDYMRIAGCVHDWQVDPHPSDHERPNHWKCINCGGKRWWREKHERGDATLGYVLHESYKLEGHTRNRR
jgi:hypothetical protein